MKPELNDEELRCLLDYARRKFEEERWPLSPELRPVRLALAKLNSKPEPLPPPKTGEPSTLLRKKKRR
jgi:hypothetical protein